MSFCRMVLQLIYRIWLHGLVYAVLLVQDCGWVYPLLVVPTMWFGIPKVCRTKQEYKTTWNIVSKAMKYVMSMTYRGTFLLGEAAMKHIKLPFTKGGSLLIREVGWVRTGSGLGWVVCGDWRCWDRV